MGMTIREALDAANKRLMKKIDNAMSNEVFEDVQVKEVAAINDVVYKVYMPSLYSRRGAFGGLADPHNIEIVGGTARDGVMVVVNRTEPSPGGCRDSSAVTTNKNLPELIEFGHEYKSYRYDFPRRGAAYMEPRPFTAKTIEYLKKSRSYILALQSGLQRQGVKVRWILK